MAEHPPSGGNRDFVTIFKTGSVDRDDYPDLAEHLLEPGPAGVPLSWEAPPFTAG
jgi:hypothetical protein